jgi:hypothetical protein
LRHICAGEDGANAGAFAGRVRIDVADQRVSVRRTNDDCDKIAVLTQIVGIAALAG